MKKQLFLIYFIAWFSCSSITQTAGLKIMLTEDYKNDKNKYYITARHYDILFGTLTASLESENCIYHIEIAPEYKNTGIAFQLLAAMGTELKVKNPQINLATLKFTHLN